MATARQIAQITFERFERDTRELTDTEYLEAVDELTSSLEAAADAKREELGDDERV